MMGVITQIKDLFIKKDNSETNDYIEYFEYENGYVSISNNKNDLVSNYEFDENHYLLTEYSMKDNELVNMTVMEEEEKCCSYTISLNNKNDQKKIMERLILSKDNYTSKLSITVLNNYSTDYILYAFAEANSEIAIRRIRKTAYCTHTNETIQDYVAYFEMRCVLIYGSETITYSKSFNPYIKTKQLAAMPVTLKEDRDSKVILPDELIVFFDYKDNNGSCIISDVTLTLGDYAYSEYNEAYNKTADYYSEVVLPKMVMGEKQGQYISKKKIDYAYNYNELLESQVETIYYEEYDLNNNLVSTDTKMNTKSYKYNSNNKLIKKEDSKGNVVEYLYSDKGSCIMKKSYHKSLPNQAYMEEYEYDENGNIIKEANSLGYKEEYKYNSESNSMVTTPNGNIIHICSSDTSKSISTEVDGLDNYSNSVYELDKLIEYNAEGMKYNYTYDDYGREKELYINDKLYCSFSYLETTTTISYKTLYPDNSGFEKITDKYGNTLRINKIISNTSIRFMEYELDSFDRVIKEKQYMNGKEYFTTYNYVENTLVSIQTNDFTKSTNFDMYNKESETTYQLDNNVIQYKSEYNDDILNNYSIVYNDKVLYQEELKADKLNRLVYNTNTLLRENYTYLSKNGRTTNLISFNQKNINGNIQRYKYNYDKEGNIISKEENHSSTRYTYDSLNRLIREDNKSLNKTYIYTYDSNGNILSKGIYDYTLDNNLENEEIIRYNYNDFNDYLSNYNGEKIEYDSIGNPIIYRNKNLCWEQRNLVNYENYKYTYNSHNIRTSKYIGNKKIDYILDGKTILKEIITNYTTYLYLDEALNDSETVNETIEEIEYIYSKSGVIGFKYNNELYYYNKNILGDILEIYDSNYNLVGKYQYDAWGNHKIVVNIDNIANINPFRYRSYYYDSETQLYWVSSRYYSPELCRWISPDSIEYLVPESINGLNLYAYCNNDPVNKYDPTGHIAISLIVGLVVSFAIGTTASAISQYAQYGDVNWLQAGVDGLFAVASTALAYTGIGLIGSIAAGAGMGLAQYTLDSAVFHDDFSWSGALIATGLGALGGLASGRGAQHFKSIGSNLDDTGRTGVKAILTAFDKYGTGAGYQKVMNLWGGRVANSLAKSISQNFTKSALIIWGTTAATYGASYGLGQINWGF